MRMHIHKRLRKNPLEGDYENLSFQERSLDHSRAGQSRRQPDCMSIDRCCEDLRNKCIAYKKVVNSIKNICMRKTTNKCGLEKIVSS